jgi:hypothetical protein
VEMWRQFDSNKIVQDCTMEFCVDGTNFTCMYSRTALEKTSCTIVIALHYGWMQQKENQGSLSRAGMIYI